MCVGIMVKHYSDAVTTANAPELYFAHYFTDTFFILSGFFLARSFLAKRAQNGAYARFIRDRLARVYPLFAVTNLFYIVPALLSAAGLIEHSFGATEQYDLSRAVPVLLLIDAWGAHQSLVFNYPTWAISALFLQYLLLPLYLVLLDRAGRWHWVAPIAAIAIAEIISLAATGEPSTNLRAHFGALHALPSFVFGVWAARIPIPRLSRRWAAGALAGYTLLACAILPLHLDGVARYVWVFIGFGAVLLTDASQVRTPLAWSPLVRFARYSLAIFMLHPVAGTLVAFTLHRIMPHPSFAAEIASLGLAACITLVGAVAAYHWLEEPARRLLIGRTSPHRRELEATAQAG